MEYCNLCPRNCHVSRVGHRIGVCGQSENIKIARAALHFWEEPCISGTNGSGAVFFSGCSLHCIYCQNHEIANGNNGREISVEHLSEIFLDLKEQGAHNINLVTATQFIPQIIKAIESARNQGMDLPIVYNSSGYEKVDTIRMLEGIVDIYLPDFKYMDSELAYRFSHAVDYPVVAKAAVREMVRQIKSPVYTNREDLELMLKGIIVRHLVLPGHIRNTKEVIRYLYETYGNEIVLSIMSQYTPMPHILSGDIQELKRKVTKREYQKVVEFCCEMGITNAFIQEGDVALESFIPAFDGYGVKGV